MNSRPLVAVSALMGFAAVALGAFGAHGLKATFEQLAIAKEWWATAAQYHLIHAAVLLGIALHAPAHVWGWRLILAGTLLFSGTLYLMAVTNIRWLGAITPIGGTLLLAGWLLLVPWKKAEGSAQD